MTQKAQKKTNVGRKKGDKWLKGLLETGLYWVLK